MGELLIAIGAFGMGWFLMDVFWWGTGHYGFVLCFLVMVAGFLL